MREVTFLPAAVCFSTYFMNRPRSVAPSGTPFYPPAGKPSFHRSISQINQIVANRIVTVILHRLAGNGSLEQLAILADFQLYTTHPFTKSHRNVSTMLMAEPFHRQHTERILKRQYLIDVFGSDISFRQGIPDSTDID